MSESNEITPAAELGAALGRAYGEMAASFSQMAASFSQMLSGFALAVVAPIEAARRWRDAVEHIEMIAGRCGMPDYLVDITVSRARYLGHVTAVDQTTALWQQWDRTRRLWGQGWEAARDEAGQ